jgi:hypothetical protein
LHAIQWILTFRHVAPFPHCSADTWPPVRRSTVLWYTYVVLRYYAHVCFRRHMAVCTMTHNGHDGTDRPHLGVSARRRPPSISIKVRCPIASSSVPPITNIPPHDTSNSLNISCMFKFNIMLTLRLVHFKKHDTTKGTLRSLRSRCCMTLRLVHFKKHGTNKGTLRSLRSRFRLLGVRCVYRHIVSPPPSTAPYPSSSAFSLSSPVVHHS